MSSPSRLYRQILNGGKPLYMDSSKTPCVLHTVFLPTNQDTDGLSMIDADLRTKIWSAHRPERPDKTYYLTLLAYADINVKAIKAELGSLSLKVTPDGVDNITGPPYAHCVVCEVNRTVYDDNSMVRARIKEWARSIVASLLVSDVEGPFRSPTDADPYRPTPLE